MKSITIDRNKRLKEEPQTGHNRWHPDIPPILEVDPGEEVVLETRDASDCQIKPGMAAGFPAGKPDAHQLVNETKKPVLYLEIGDRTPGDGANYADVDMAARAVDGKWVFTHKDGSPYK